MSNLVSLSPDGRAMAQILQEDGLSQVPPLDCYPVVSLGIKKLALDGSPRTSGEDLDHARVLADVRAGLPPILVHRPTLRVIDGRHRIRAALLNGETTIDARLVDCDEATAFLLGVHANITHGLPLCLADRKAAATSIIRSHPHWSDRAVARSSGLSDKTVSAIRASSTSESPQSNERQGKDGRVRPLNSAVKRRQAAAMLSAEPEASLRDVARATGLSPATVRDVRKRTDRGENPVPLRYREEGSTDNVPQAPPRVSRAASRAKPLDPKALLAKLMNDPALRFSESGRLAVRWLHRYSLDPEGCEHVVAYIPDHWAASVAELARGCAAAWARLAEQLAQRSYDDDPEESSPARRATSAC